MSPLGIVLIVSGLLKVVLAIVFGDLAPRYDEAEFVELGSAVAAGEAPSLFRAPGYQAFVAIGLSITGGSTGGVRILQAILSGVTTWLVYRTTRRVASERIALAVAAFVAFYPSHVAFSHLLWTETLFLFFVVWSFDRLLVADDRSSARDAAYAGLLLGAASLVRSMGIALLAASVVWALLRRERRVPMAAALLVAALVVIAPWSMHASSRQGSFVLVDTNGAWNLFSGHNEWIPEGLPAVWGVGLPLDNGVEILRGRQLAARGLPPRLALERPGGDFRQELQSEQRLGSSDRPVDSWFRDAALEEIRRDPVDALCRVPLKLAAWWAPDFFLPRHLLRDWYGAVPPGLALAIAVLTVFASAVPLLLGPAAVAALPRSGFSTLAVAWLAAGVVVHGLLFGVSRMHQPFVPLLVMAVGMAVLGATRPDGARRLLRRGLPWSIVALGCWVLSAPVVAGLYVAPGARHVGVARAMGQLGETPLPGARYATWMRAEVEAAAGDPREAERLLASTRHAEHPWTVCQRALLVEDRDEAGRLVDGVLAEPDAPGLAQRLRVALARGGR